MTDDWPYDADWNDPLTQLRIPVVNTPYPRWSYLVALDTGADRLDGQWVRPTDAEAQQLASFTRHAIERWYNPTWKRKLAERPFDIDEGAHGLVFCKYGPDDWGFRRSSWRVGALYFPQPPSVRNIDNAGPYTLVRMMDHFHSAGMGPSEVSSFWAAWKAAHPEVFGEQA